MTVRLPMICAAIAAISCSAAATASVTTFDDGTNGWGVFHENDGMFGDFLLPTGGNPGANLNFVMVDTWGASLSNTTNQAVLGDYGRFNGGVQLSVDVKVNSIVYDPWFTGGWEVERHLVVELMSYNPEGSDYPWVSVWYDFGPISSWATGDWTTFGITIDDPNSATLPSGWGGYGAEDPNTFEPMLPADRTFASVLANVDEIRFTTFVPGYFYGFTYFDLQYDNVTVQGVPGPGALALGVVGAAFMRRRRR